ncbi:MAG: MBOAT family protein [Betaproteobacteria bacterium]|nr:MAG: MBOAT family protein [Betaproteobacteria bacterium]
MLFNTLSYLAFLAVCVALYWLLPVTGKRALILVASLLFYAAWRIEFVLLIAFSAFVDYYLSLKIHAEKESTRRRLLLLLSLSTNLGLLLYFKYTYFILDNVHSIGRLFGHSWSFDPGTIILPLGISFYTFLSISYTIDVYRRLVVPERRFDIYLSYVMFWPHMIAGPILRASELLPQLKTAAAFRLEDIVAGARAIMIGLFLKVALADQISPLVDDAFATDPGRLSGIDVWTMAFAFGFQIYFDFAGYSLVAIGSARLLGVRFPQNFDWPYLATSPRDFWKRWHITLSSWIRDYLYLPLAGQRFRDRSEGGIDIQPAQAQSSRLLLALFLSWFIMGLWHGASWSFAFWGLWHATLVFGYRVFRNALPGIRGALRSVIGWALTLPVVMLGWIPFRAGSLENSLALLGRTLDLSSYTRISFRENFYLVTFLLLVGMLLLRAVTSPHVHRSWGMRMQQLADVAMLSAVMFVVFVFLRPISQFIYFQF